METVSYQQHVCIPCFVYQKEGNCIIPTICLWSRFCISEKGKLYHTNNMSVFYVLCIRKRETVSYQQYVYDLEFVYQKEGNCIIPTLCLWSRYCVAERKTVSYLQYIYVLEVVYQKGGSCIIPTICLWYRFCVAERGKLSYLQYVYDLDFVLQREVNCVIPTIYLWSRFCVSERGKLYHTYSTFMFQMMCVRQRETVLHLQYV